MNVSVGEARDRLTQLLKAVEDGQKVTITRNGKPIVEMVPVKQTSRRKFGTLPDVVNDSNWNRPQENIEAWLAGDV